METTRTLPRRPRGRPARNGLDYADTRALLIRRGLEILTTQGVSATALDDVLKSINVPKGSFYHYFASKDAFVAATVDTYAEYFARKLKQHFHNPLLTPLARLAAFVDDACHGVERHAFKRGCLVGNLGQEVSALDERLRLRLEAIFFRLGASAGRLSVSRGKQRRTGDGRRLPGTGARFLGWLGGGDTARQAVPLDGADARLLQALSIGIAAPPSFFTVKVASATHETAFSPCARRVGNERAVMSFHDCLARSYFTGPFFHHQGESPCSRES
jgi:AcrR family transcriptional regulator